MNLVVLRSVKSSCLNVSVEVFISKYVKILSPTIVSRLPELKNCSPCHQVALHLNPLEFHLFQSLKDTEPVNLTELSERVNDCVLAVFLVFVLTLRVY